MKAFASALLLAGVNAAIAAFDFTTEGTLSSFTKSNASANFVYLTAQISGVKGGFTTAKNATYKVQSDYSLKKYFLALTMELGKGINF